MVDIISFFMDLDRDRRSQSRSSLSDPIPIRIHKARKKTFSLALCPDRIADQ